MPVICRLPQGSGGGKSLILPDNTPNVFLDPGDSKLVVTWQHPTDSEVAIDHYNLYWTKSDKKPSSLKEFANSAKVSGTETSYTITGLTNEAKYYVVLESVSVEGYENASLRTAYAGTSHELMIVGFCGTYRSSSGRYYVNIITSSDMNTWEQKYSAGGVTNQYNFTIAKYVKNVWSFYYSNYTLDTPTLFYSANNLDTFVAGTRINQAVYGKSDYDIVVSNDVIFIKSYQSGTGDLYSKNGGKDFIFLTNTKMYGDIYDKCFAESYNGKFAMIGRPGATYSNNKIGISMSDDCENWTMVNSAIGDLSYGSSGSTSYRCYIFEDGTIVLLEIKSDTGSLRTFRVLYSKDEGKTFVFATNSSVKCGDFILSAYGNGRLVIIFSGYGDSKYYIWVTKNGSEWTKIEKDKESSMFPSSSFNAVKLYYANNRFIFMNADQNTKFKCYISSDGINYTESTMFSNMSVNSQYSFICDRLSLAFKY